MPARISCAADVSCAKTSVEAPIARMMIQATIRRARPRQDPPATLRNQVLLAFVGIGNLIARTKLVRADRVEGHSWPPQQATADPSTPAAQTQRHLRSG